MTRSQKQLSSFKNKKSNVNITQIIEDWQYEVEEILDQQERLDGIYFLIKWKFYLKPTWEHSKNLSSY